MLLRYALLGAAALAVAGIADVRAQSPFPPVAGEKPSPFPPVGQQTQQSSPFPPVGQQSTTFPPVGGQQASPFSTPGQVAIPQMGQPQQQQQPPQQQQQPPCAVELMVAGQEMEKRMTAARTGMEKKLGAAEMCRLITQYTVAEEQLIKSLEKNSAACGVPLDVIKKRKAGLAQANGGKKQACEAAANPGAPRGPRAIEPTLSDAFAPPPLNGNNTRTGRGTLDSLGGNPLAR